MNRIDLLLCMKVKPNSENCSYVLRVWSFFGTEGKKPNQHSSLNLLSTKNTDQNINWKKKMTRPFSPPSNVSKLSCLHSCVVLLFDFLIKYLNGRSLVTVKRTFILKTFYIMYSQCTPLNPVKQLLVNVAIG